MKHAAIAKQGHRYKLGSKSVLAMQTGLVVEVREIDISEVYPLVRPVTVKASWLQPERMRYHGGAVPE